MNQNCTIFQSFTKKSPRVSGGFFRCESESRFALLRAGSGEAILAENRLATLLYGARLERNLALVATLSTHGIEHLAVAKFLSLAGIAAILAALRRTEVLGVVELLFTFSERKCGTAVAASKLLISHKNKKERIEWQFPSLLVFWRATFGGVRTVRPCSKENCCGHSRGSPRFVNENRLYFSFITVICYFLSSLRQSSLPGQNRYLLAVEVVPVLWIFGLKVPGRQFPSSILPLLFQASVLLLQWHR